MENKLIILATVIIASIVNISGQPNYFPLVSGNYWEYITETNYLYKYQVFTDTVIENRQFFKYGRSEYVEYHLRWENSGKLYAYNTYVSKEYLWFDFSLKEGDTCFINDGFDDYYAIVLSDSLTVETEKGTFENCKFVHFFSPFMTDSDKWYYFAPEVGIIKMSGAWLPQMSLIDCGIELPTHLNQRNQAFSLENLNCYPNPFRNEISISINVNSLTNCRIEVYDSKGRIIKEIHNGILGIGKHDFFLREKAIQPNIYFVVLSNEDERIIKKILLMK